MTKKEWSIKFAKRIEYFLDRLDMYQIDLAVAAGITPVRLSRYLNGHHIPSATVIVNIAKALHVSSSDLIDFGEWVD